MPSQDPCKRQRIIAVLQLGLCAPSGDTAARPRLGTDLGRRRLTGRLARAGTGGGPATGRGRASKPRPVTG